MAANPENFRIEEGVLTWVSDDYIKKNNGYFEIPDSVTTIGICAFTRCISLKQVTIPNSVKKINDGAFASCTSLEQVSIPESVTTFGNFIFNRCANLGQVVIYDSLPIIASNTFWYCPKELEITIIATEPTEEKAMAVKARLQTDYSNMSIHIDSPYNNIKGDSSSPSFFSLSSNPEGGEPSSNNQHKPGA